MTLKVIFMGTPDFSIPTLAEIISKGHEVVAVYTQPPRKAGRGGKVRKTPVHDYAEQAGIPVFTPKSLKRQEEQQHLLSLGADVAVVIAYGLLLPKAILEGLPLGCINVHGSLLPRWRGAAPIQRALMAGDKATGVMIMQMDEGLDTGDILLSEHIPLGPETTAGELHDEMMVRGADLLGRALEALKRGSLLATPQPEEGATYAQKISKSESKIDWSKSATDIHNHIRGLSPYPGAWFEAETTPGKTERIKILRSKLAPKQTESPKISEKTIIVNCGEDAIQLIELQKQGKKPLKAEDFINGLKGELKIKQH